MDRSSAVVRLLLVGCRRAAIFGVVLAIVAPACAGRSISHDDDGEAAPVPPNDDGDEPPSGDDDGGSLGGMGAVGNAGTTGVTGGAFTSGGAFPTGGTTAIGGASTTGGSIAVGGRASGGVAGVPSTGGSTPCAGSGSGADRPGQSGGVGGAGGVNIDPQCKGIRSNTACPVEGTACRGLVCGLADAGRRDCTCATNWTCTACDYSNSWVSRPPCDFPACPADAVDEAPCLSEHTICGPVGTEYCACYSDPTDGLIWDCDDPPSTWTCGC